MNLKQEMSFDCHRVELQRAAFGCFLTSREIEVLECLVEGHCNKEIARKLFVSTDTVKAHLKSAFVKLGVNDRTAAVIHALRLGSVHLNGISIESVA